MENENNNAGALLLRQFLYEKSESIIIVEIDRNFSILDVNDAFLKLVRLEEKPLERNIKDFICQASAEGLMEALEKGGPVPLSFCSGSTSLFSVKVAINFVQDRYVIIGEKPVFSNEKVLEQMTLINNEMANMSRELKRKNTDLEIAGEHLTQLLEEKEVLMQELNHRIANNLNIITSILNLQMMKSDDSSKKIIQDVKSRIHTIALMHRKLYQSNNIDTIELKDFLESLIGDIQRTLLTPGSGVTVKTDLADAMVSTKNAVSIGIIANELLTNAVKYAFPGDRGGEIAVRSTRSSGEKGLVYNLSIADNGIGTSVEERAPENKSLGMLVVKSIIKELKGEINFISNGGLTVDVHFPII